MDVISLSHQGKVKPGNEDGLLELGELGIYGVLDGLSSTSGGGMATLLALELLRELLPKLGLEQALAEASRRIWAQGLRSRAMFQMGAAVVLARVRDESVELAHAGDCRAYLDGRRLTEDHSVLARGKLSLVRHLGLRELKAERQEQAFGPGSRLLLCSDGLHRELGEDALAELMRTGTPEEAARALLEGALDRGGRDNISLIVLERNFSAMTGAVDPSATTGAVDS